MDLGQDEKLQNISEKAGNAQFDLKKNKIEQLLNQMKSVRLGLIISVWKKESRCSDDTFRLA